MSYATFEANPNSENEPWIEHPSFEGGKFRNWHLMFFSLSVFGILIILICCCIKFRIPRTKQEIEANYKRKQIASKFEERLKIINNQEMEIINLKKALEIIIEDEKLQQEDNYEDNKSFVSMKNKQTFKSFAKNAVNILKINAPNNNN